LLLCVPFWAQAEDFSFDISGYEKKPYEWGGYLELTGEHVRLDRDAAFYNLNFDDSGQPDDFNRYTGALELEGLYRFDRSSVHSRVHAEVSDDYFGNHCETSIHELYYSARPSDKLTLEAGKRLLKWGKGYAWSPVAFVERTKDPNDPDLTREGFVLATADYVRTFDGPLKTLAFTPVILPVSEDFNDDFSREEDVNFAGKLYLLYRDTDIDFLFLGDGSRSGRVGLDFSRNLTSNLEVHGELAYIDDQRIVALDAQNQVVTNTRDVTSGLLGLRYLTKSDITWIAEYYRNGAGYSESELERFYSLAHSDSLTTPDLFALAERARSRGYGAPNPGRDYLYLRASKKESFGVVYLNAGFTSIINLRDESFSFTPEAIYTGIENTEVRLRLVFVEGETSTEFGEKQNDSRLEFRVRFFF
jgi:hypothetical protein